MSELRTPRLLLRHWRDTDLAPWAALNADPEVRAHLGGVLSRERSDASARLFEAELTGRGWGWWAVEVTARGADEGRFIGFAGLDPVDEEMPFTGVEAGWRLARSAWGHGYATEAARAVLDHGFGVLALPEILAVTTVGNLRSQAVMRRIGMTRDPADDFEDPTMPEGQRAGVVYRLSAADHLAARRAPTPGS